MSIFLTTPPRHAMLLLLLPTFHAALNPCPVSAAALTPHEQGRYCGQCRRVVQDFTQSLNPAADLAAARAAAPDGRVCGSFSRAQVTAPPPLSRRLRWFVVALVLVVGQGLTAREALAQVRTEKASVASYGIKAPTIAAPAFPSDTTGLQPAPSAPLAIQSLTVGWVIVDSPPSFQGGGMAAIIAYIQEHMKWPAIMGRECVEGRVFTSFTVGHDGRVRDVKTVKSLHPALDEEVRRVVQEMPLFKPATQDGRPVSMTLTVPTTFRLK